MGSPADITGIQMEMVSQNRRGGVIRRPFPDPDLPNPGRYENGKGPNDPMNPTSPKVWAGGAGAAFGTILSTLLIWLIGASAFNGGWAADQVDNAIAAVPSPLAGFILLLVTGTLTMVGAYAKTDPERLPTLGDEQRRRVGLQGVDVRPRRELSDIPNDGNQLG